MGTNYYLSTEQYPEFDRLHIGKSSGGWCFGLHVMPERGINDLEDWKRLWQKPGVIIVSEYDDTRYSAEEMLAIITERFWKGRTDNRDSGWYSINHATDGPNRLTRHRIGAHCIGHGEGTWDLITGEFS